MFLTGQRLKTGIVYPVCEILLKVAKAHPRENQEGIHKSEINVLVAVYRQPFLCGALSQQTGLCNIIINTLYVRIGMMQDIVFDFPEGGIATHGIQRIS
jgi:hypothetical protein